MPPKPIWPNSLAKTHLALQALEYLVVGAGEQVHVRIKFPTYVKVVVCADHKRKGWIPMAFLLNDPYDKPPPPTEAPPPRMLPVN